MLRSSHSYQTLGRSGILLLFSILLSLSSPAQTEEIDSNDNLTLTIDSANSSLSVRDSNTATSNLNQQDYDYLNKFTTLKMCIDPDWMPFEKFEGKQHIGMTADYFDLIQKQLPVPIEVVYTRNWNESLQMGKQRKCDIFSLVMPTPERLTYLSFSKPYIQTPVVLVTESTEPFIDNVSLVTDRRIGIVQGYAYGEILRNKYPDMQLIDVDNLESGLDLVNKGELYGLIGTLATVSFHIQKSYIGELKITGKFDEKWELGIGIRNDEPRLVDIFSKIIENLPQNVHQKILNKWVSVTFESGFDYKLFTQVITALAIIMLGFFYWNYRLAKAHKRTTAALHALHQAEEKLQLLATTDHLTGIYNRLKLDEIVDTEIQRCKRTQRPFSALLIDIDHFKNINDEHGHLVGDEILKEVTQVIQHRLREMDSFGRWGGEEFLIICPETNTEQATNLAETVRETIQNHQFSGEKNITLSIGVTSFKHFDSNTILTSRVDQALYEAKHSGRNCVIAID